jgi:hypothetical protein
MDELLFLIQYKHSCKHQIYKMTERESAKAICLTWWKSELDWAQSGLHNSRRMGGANLLAMWPHPTLLGPVKNDETIAYIKVR